MTLARLVAVAGPFAILFAALGFAASVGGHLLPPLPAEAALLLHLALGALGFGAAWAAIRRTEEIERRRAEYVTDPLATKQERETAHREAERERNAAHRALAGAALALGFWLAYALEPGASPWARALPATALAGYGTGMALLLWRESRRAR